MPRSIAKDFRAGKLKRIEFLIYVWLRIKADKWGVSITSLSGIKEVFFRKKTHPSYVNRILLSLKRKEYIYFDKRQGHKGEFDVYIGDWLISKGRIRTLDEVRTHLQSKKEMPTNTQKKSEVSQNFEAPGQKLMEQKQQLIQGVSMNQQKPEVRSSYTNTDTEKEIETNESLAKKPFKGIVTRTFVPSNDHEEACWKIALELGDPYMDYILKILKNNGLETIRDAKAMYESIRAENERGGKPSVKKPAALFNWCVQRIVDGERALKEDRELYGDDSIGRE